MSDIGRLNPGSLQYTSDRSDDVFPRPWHANPFGFLVCIAATQNSTQDVRTTAIGMFSTFQYENRRTLSQHHAIALGIKWP
jgi:hypothetical protein